MTNKYTFKYALWFKEYAVVIFTAVVLPGDFTDWYWWVLMVTFAFLLAFHDDVK